MDINNIEARVEVGEGEAIYTYIYIYIYIHIIYTYAYTRAAFIAGISMDTRAGREINK